MAGRLSSRIAAVSSSYRLSRSPGGFPITPGWAREEGMPGNPYIATMEAGSGRSLFVVSMMELLSSRGCGVTDTANAVAITAIQAGALRSDA